MLPISYQKSLRNIARMFITRLFYLISVLQVEILYAGHQPPSNIETNMRIINGRLAKDYEFPYFVMVKRREWCGGVLIGNGTVLTAGHCVYEKEPEYIKYYIVGPNRFDPFHPWYSPAKTWVHEGYSFNGTDPPTHDIALVQLNLFLGPKVEKFAIAKLPTKRYPPKTPVTICGYVITEKKWESVFLKAARAKIIESDKCFPTFICIESPVSSICYGDSGSPILVRGKTPDDDVVVGLTSFGHLKCDKGLAAQFSGTDVCYYLEWINDKLNRIKKWTDNK